MSEEFEKQAEERPKESRSHGWMAAFLIIFLGMATVGGAVAYRQSQHIEELSTQLSEREQSANQEISQMREQMDRMAETITVLSTPPPGKAGAAGSGSDRRVRQLQAKVSEQEKQLKETRDAIDQARTDLDGRLLSTRDELGGSIARTQDELVLLRKRGENDYFEFDLSKSKKFQRVGPISLSLRKADVKRKRYDLKLLVDDNELEKKSVNLYEPVQIHRTDDPHPLQLVIFRVEKNRVHGYVMAPKFRNSELAAVPTAPVPLPPQED